MPVISTEELLKDKKTISTEELFAEQKPKQETSLPQSEILPLNLSPAGRMQQKLRQLMLKDPAIYGATQPAEGRVEEFIRSGINAATLGLPQAIGKMAGIPPMKSKYPLASTGGMLTGSIIGAPRILYQATNKIIPSRIPFAETLRGAVTGAALPPEDFLSGKERLKQGAIGGVFSFILNGLPNLINIGGKKSGYKIAQQASGSLDKAGKLLSDKYDDLFASIESKSKISTNNIVQSLDDYINQFPEGENVSKVKTILNRLASETKEGKKQIADLSVKELHNLKQEVRKLIPKGVWEGKIDSNAMQHSLENIYWQINNELAKLGGEKYVNLAKEYKQLKDAERFARGYFYEKGMVSEAGMKKPLSYAGRKAIQTLEKTNIPSEEQFLNKFIAWQRGQEAKKLGLRFGLGYGTYEILKNTLGRK